MEVFVGKGGIIEETVRLTGSPILFVQAAFVQTLEETGIDFDYFFPEELSEQGDPLFSSCQSATGASMLTTFLCSFTFFKEMDAPECFPTVVENVVFWICYRPSNRACSDVESKIVVSDFFPHSITELTWS